MKGFFFSLQTYVQAFALIPKLRLWKYFLVPGIISLLFAAFIGFAVWTWGDDLGGLLTGWIQASDADSLWARIGNFFVAGVQKISGVFGSILILLLAVLVFKNFVIAFTGPLMSGLSEKVETHLTGTSPKSPAFFSSMFRGISLAIRNLLRELVFVIPLFFIGLMPLFSIFSAILILLIQSYYAGFAHFDFVLERKMNKRASIQMIRSQRGISIGNGIVYMLLIGTLVGIFFATPLATIASTIAYCKRNA